MKNYTNIAIIASFFRHGSTLSSTNIQIFWFFFIFTFGILHGANDLLFKI
jgi:hypothetical protein